ncbi:succinylglutamate desuccinylase/aspartoacylase family protein [Phaeodactylibacter luteus]|uniref:Succinylglutamate desuccinylase/aspartoacylase family protein n=1 Tax=Phaeodactylibacter luteus TaxID=1564516 RepID=A0A5C6RZB9_9BACT|nr:succinylglutamate desuccinylase/aspartoacylase family protein [Phaeodactylibacter luteus]TXB67631.1 succinylglutamate desuccinylase/aspartoacylase family protein [Phaeodactylibacter luteus]
MTEERNHSEELFKVHKTVVAPGASEVVRLPVGALPTGRQILMEAHVFRAVEPGPVGLLLAGVHGDETNGIEIVRRTLEEGWFHNMQRGSIIALPVVNVYGFINYSREMPDGKDVNRSFPGSSRGSLASRVAHAITRRVLPLADWLIDFHTGGGRIYNYPQVRYSPGDEGSEQLAAQFGAPFSVGKAPIRQSLRRVAQEQGKPALVFEGGESLRYDAFAVEEGLNGLRRVLVGQGMLGGGVSGQPFLRHDFPRQGWVRAPKAGMFEALPEAGAHVVKGQELGFIHSPYGEKLAVVSAPRDGHLIACNRAPVVNQGDALFHLGYEGEESL